MHLLFRTLLMWLRRNGPRIGIHEISRVSLRVLPTDLDVLGHMNNGVYLSIMDLGRMDLLQRSGVWARFTKAGYYPVIANETISFRRSLLPWQRFTVETRIIGYDAKAVFLQQRMTVGGEVYAEAFVRARFLRKNGGTASIEQIMEATGEDGSGLELPEWVGRWAEDVALPGSRSPAPSRWS
ncbi:MAG TPA: thioesterase family protein [Lacisediminihabitans sp.]|uniref:thioesterase family protein n=1 Tax=Lacisediminihabitans sp. TaxID=2787631 RepID=UPI002ED7D99E